MRSQAKPNQIDLEIARGEGLYLREAAKRIPSYRRGKPVTLGCLLRWVLEGVSLPTGETVRLEAARLANKWVTTESAIARFVAAQSPDLSNGTSTKSETKRSRTNHSAAAAEQLEKLGI